MFSYNKYKKDSNEKLDCFGYLGSTCKRKDAPVFQCLKSYSNSQKKANHYPIYASSSLEELENFRDFSNKNKKKLSHKKNKSKLNEDSFNDLSIKIDELCASDEEPLKKKEDNQIPYYHFPSTNDCINKLNKLKKSIVGETKSSRIKEAHLNREESRSKKSDLEINRSTKSSVAKRKSSQKSKEILRQDSVKRKCCKERNATMGENECNDLVVAYSAFRNACAHILLLISFLISIICKFFIELFQATNVIKNPGARSCKYPNTQHVCETGKNIFINDGCEADANIYFCKKFPFNEANEASKTRPSTVSQKSKAVSKTAALTKEVGEERKSVSDKKKLSEKESQKGGDDTEADEEIENDEGDEDEAKDETEEGEDEEKEDNEDSEGNESQNQNCDKYKNKKKKKEHLPTSKNENIIKKAKKKTKNLNTSRSDKICCKTKASSKDQCEKIKKPIKNEICMTSDTHKSKSENKKNIHDNQKENMNHSPFFTCNKLQKSPEQTAHQQSVKIFIKKTEKTHEDSKQECSDKDFMKTQTNIKTIVVKENYTGCCGKNQFSPMDKKEKEPKERNFDCFPKKMREDSCSYCCQQANKILSNFSLSSCDFSLRCDSPEKPQKPQLCLDLEHEKSFAKTPTKLVKKSYQTSESPKQNIKNVAPSATAVEHKSTLKNLEAEKEKLVEMLNTDKTVYKESSKVEINTDPIKSKNEIEQKDKDSNKEDNKNLLPSSVLKKSTVEPDEELVKSTVKEKHSPNLLVDKENDLNNDKNLPSKTVGSSEAKNEFLKLDQKEVSSPLVKKRRFVKEKPKIVSNTSKPQFFQYSKRFSSSKEPPPPKESTTFLRRFSKAK